MASESHYAVPPHAAVLHPSVLLHAYRIGLFPMADPDDGDRVFWYAPDPRAILPLDGLRVSRSLRQRLRRETYSVTVDCAFERVIRACAVPAPGREQRWISEEITQA